MLRQRSFTNRVQSLKSTTANELLAPLERGLRDYAKKRR
jgi:hypothetical protein